MRLATRFRPLWARLALLAAVVGPGIITANVDNDAGGITTYSIAGAHFGYSILWIMPLVAVVLILVQEMSARLGVVTGKGLADLIRESLGVRITALVVGDPRCRQPRQHGERVRRCRGGHGDLRREQVHLRAGGSGAGLAPHRAGELQDGGAGVPRGERSST